MTKATLNERLNGLARLEQLQLLLIQLTFFPPLMFLQLFCLSGCQNEGSQISHRKTRGGHVHQSQPSSSWPPQILDRQDLHCTAVPLLLWPSSLTQNLTYDGGSEVSRHFESSLVQTCQTFQSLWILKRQIDPSTVKF